MSKELTTFNFQNHEVRTVVIDDTPYWVAKDVAEVLGYANTNKAVNDHCRGVTKRYPIVDALGRTQEARVIGESDLYRLIAHSNLPAAVEFEAWIFEEVLPAIRKTGGYVKAAQEDTPEMIMARAVLVAQDTINRQKAQIEGMKPKALFADAVSASQSSILIGELAKILKQNGVDTGQNRLFTWLRDNGWLIRRKGTDYNMPTQRGMEMGLFEIKENAVAHSDGHVSVTKTTKVTGKGQVHFVNLFLRKQESDAPEEKSA